MSDQRPDPERRAPEEELAAELLRRVRRSESRRLDRVYSEILSEGARSKSPEQEEQEWQIAAKPDERRGEPTWGTVLKRGTLFAIPLLVGPLTFAIVGHLLFPQAMHRFNPDAVGGLTAIGVLLSPIAFLLGVMTAK